MLINSRAQHQSVAGKVAMTEREQRQAFVHVRGNVFQAVHGGVDRAVVQRLLQFLREQPLDAEFVRGLRKRFHVHVAGGDDRDDFQTVIRVRRAHGVHDQTRLRERKRAFSRAKTKGCHSSVSSFLCRSSATICGQSSRIRSARRRVRAGSSPAVETQTDAAPQSISG